MNDAFGTRIDGIDKVMASGNAIILDAMMKCDDVLRRHEHAVVSVSGGGGDSDVMLDLVERVRGGTGCEVTYMFLDTGFEYRATRDHLDLLEERYGIEIRRFRAEKTIPTCAREYGQPFVSKYVSQNISRLQRAGFRWEDEPLDALLGRYANCLSALKWWTNSWTRTDQPGHFDIGRTRFLKEFLVENPPTFAISDKCCDFAKKRVAKRAADEIGGDVELVGIRKAEGGIRASVFSSCFDAGNESRPYDMYRPLFWFSGEDKREYERLFGVRHSRCYTEWGFRRTGCVCCPFGRNLEEELAATRVHEPRMARAAESVFADTYRYTREFREFRRERMTGQMALDLRFARTESDW